MKTPRITREWLGSSLPPLVTFLVTVIVCWTPQSMSAASDDDDSQFSLGSGECLDVLHCTPVNCDAFSNCNSAGMCNLPPPPDPPPAGTSQAADSPSAMARWFVTEPAVNLWLRDTPLRYKASRGRNISFKLFYKNRLGSQGNVDAQSAEIFSVGARWHTPWRAYLQSIPGESTNFWLIHGYGMVRKLTVDIVDYLTLMKLTQVGSTNTLEGPTGGRSVFGLSHTMGGITRYFLTEQTDSFANAIRFQYSVSNSAIRLDRVIDVDNRVVTLEYTNAGPYSNVITKVLGPYSQTATMSYDSQGQLTNITDVVGLCSTLSYDSNKNLTALITPYGTNSFSYFSNSVGTVAVRVKELESRSHLYAYIPEVDGGKVSSSYADYRPSTTNGSYFSISNTFDSTNSHQRNSFHWNPRQYERLSNLIRTNLDQNDFNVSNLTSGEYLIARQKHWLKTYGSTNAGFTLSLSRDPSPDGTLQGQIKWFDYAGKNGGAPDSEGTMGRPQLVAWRLANGEARFTRTDRNRFGHVTNELSTYTCSTGVCQVRTNLYEYAANGIDLTRHIRLIGSTSQQVFSNVFNSHHQIVTNYDGLNQKATYTYNSNRQVSSISFPRGLTTSNIYESSGNWSNFLSKTIDLEIGRTNSLTYSNGSLLARTDARGLTKTYIRDLLGRSLQTLYPDGTSIRRTYDKFDLVQVVDRLGFTNGFAYNGFRQRIHVSNPRGLLTTYDYCDCGTLDSITDACGKTTTFLYDLNARRCVTGYSDGGFVTNHYNLMGQITNVTDSGGFSTTNCFNNQGLLCAVSNAFGGQKIVTHDVEDNPTDVVDANGVTNRYEYDVLHRLTRRVDGNDKVETFTYSSRGLTAGTNQLSQYTCYGYDAGGRKICQTNGNGEVLTYTYNAAGDLVKLTDGKSQETSWGYDQYGRITSKTNSTGVEVLRYAFDANGRLTNRWSIGKGNTRYVYDSAGNLILIDYSFSADVTMQYDACNRLTNMVDGGGTTRFAYTDWGGLFVEDGPWESDTVTYEYTANRLRNRMTLIQPNATAWEQTYSYDRANRLTNVTSPAGSVSYQYDPGAHLHVNRVGLPNGSYITNSYDAMARLTATVLKNSGGSTLNAHSYVYDDVSRRTRHTRTAGDYMDYTYDNAGQLKTANGHEAGGNNRVHEQFGYAYDAAWNLNIRSNNALTQTFTVNGLNELTTVSRNGSLTVAGTTSGSATNVIVNNLTAIRYSDSAFAKDGLALLDGTNTFAATAFDSLGRANSDTASAYLPGSPAFVYDSNGNMIFDGQRAFSYDDENQLIQIAQTNAWKAEFTYDGKMRRRVRKEYCWLQGSWVLTNQVRYIYDRSLVIQERDQNNVGITSYTRGQDLSGDLDSAGGIGGLLAYSQGFGTAAQHFFYHADALGNITILLNKEQIAAGKYSYDPFGNILASSGPVAGANKYRFSSKECDEKSGLVYYLYRYYNPSLQRWTTPDPLQERGGVNLFAFVNNSPLNEVDLYGLRSVQNSLCKAACWGLSTGICCYFAIVCAAGTVVTIGGVAVPCAAAVVVGCGALAAGASFCSDLCDEYAP